MLYAVHYAWINGHATKAPVGIWAEGGLAHYPPPFTGHLSGGDQALTETPNKDWAEWVEMRVEFGSTYGASWGAVESDQPMQVVLAEIQETFFAEEHPVMHFTTDEPNPDLTPAPEEPVLTSEPPVSVPPPAPRFIAAQAWWIASELCRRTSRLRIVETWPMGGFYHGLEVGEPYQPQWVFMNYQGRIHLHLDGDGRELQPIPWHDVIAASSPHQIVRGVEEGLGWTPLGADATTPRSLTYRVLAAFLTRTLNDRAQWSIADGSTASGASSYSEGDSTFLREFDGLHDAVEEDPAPNPLSRVWVLRREEKKVAVLTDRAHLYQRGAPPLDLMPAYRHRRALDDANDAVWAATHGHG